MLCRAFVIAILAQNRSVEKVSASQVRTQRQRLLQHAASASGVALLQGRTPDVDPAVGILRISFGDFFEGGLRSFQIALQKQTDAVIVPALPVFFRKLGLGLR